jgi:hypothetical protein
MNSLIPGPSPDSERNESGEGSAYPKRPILGCFYLFFTQLAATFAAVLFRRDMLTFSVYQPEHTDGSQPLTSTTSRLRRRLFVCAILG